ncbi:MAG: MBL fold metallo-hydrolase, partial [Bacilli bacterium]
MKVAVLSSGSKGNCTLVVSEKSKILIDAGVTKTYIENKLSELAVDPAEIKAIFISHTHVDHIQGLRVFIKKYNPVIFATEKLLPEL